MNKISLINQNSTGYKKSNFKGKSQYYTNTGSYQLKSDTVSFKGVNKIKPTKTMVSGAKALLLSLAGLLGIKTAVESVKSHIHSEKTLTKSEKLANELASMTYTYTWGRDNEYSEVCKLYNKTAINGIVELNEKDPQAAYNLAKILSQTDSTSKEDTQYVVDKFNQDSELVYKYNSIGTKGGYTFTPKVSLLSNLLRSADINEELTDKALEGLVNKKQYYTSADSTGIYSFMQKAKDLNPESVSKYLQEYRIPYDFNTILELSKLDKEYSKEINEIIEFTNLNVDKYHYKNNFVQNILPDYINSPNEVKKVVEFIKVADVEKVSTLVEAYKTDANLTLEMSKKSAKEDHVCIEGVNAGKVASIVMKYNQNKDCADKIIGAVKEELSTNEIERILDKINANPESIRRIIKDGRINRMDTLIPIYNKYPDREITVELINRELDPLSKLFDLD